MKEIGHMSTLVDQEAFVRALSTNQCEFFTESPKKYVLRRQRVLNLFENLVRK